MIYFLNIIHFLSFWIIQLLVTLCYMSDSRPVKYGKYVSLHWKILFYSHHENTENENTHFIYYICLNVSLISIKWTNLLFYMNSHTIKMVISGIMCFHYRPIHFSISPHSLYIMNDKNEEKDRRKHENVESLPVSLSQTYKVITISEKRQ